MAPSDGSTADTVGANRAADLDSLWVASRKGADGGRGYHFQPVVGAWLAGRVLSNHLPPGRLVPEGFEDLSFETDDGPYEIQVKSRQERVGDVPVATAAGHLLESLRGHSARVAAGRSSVPFIVWERPVVGESFGAWGEPLVRTLSPAHPLHKALLKKALGAGITSDEVASYLEVACGFVLGWHTAHEQTLDALEAVTRLPRGVLGPVVLALRGAIADRSHGNTTRDRTEQQGLSITDMEGCVQATVECINRNALEEALRLGLCEPVDFDAEVDATDFYAGVDVQPGHIGAHLTSGRPELVGWVLDAVTRFSPTLLCGPSGIGKSAVMWMSAYVTPNVRWYRVRRLRAGDVEPLIRFVREAGSSVHTPVGLIVDGVGTGAMQAWDLLQQDLASTPGATLLGSVRSEDLLPLRSLRNCTTVTVDLDEETAERIHRGLRAAGQTIRRHWRPAFEESNRLTLEYIHLLTQGRRLAGVVSDQVNQRTWERRDLELRILACSSVAHCWGAVIAVDRLSAHLSEDAGAIRHAMGRLQAEHLVRLDQQHITGIHRIRSLALVDAVHSLGVPTLLETIEDVLALLEPEQARTFLASMLGEVTDFDDRVLAGLLATLRQHTDPSAYHRVLDALRIADTRRLVRNASRILNEHGIPPADWVLVTQQAMVGGAVLEVMAEALEERGRPELVVAADAIVQAERQQRLLRAALIERLGPDLLTDVLLASSDPAEASGLLAVLEGTQHQVLSNERLQQLTTDHPLLIMLRNCEITAVADVFACVYDVAPASAHILAEAVGDDASLLHRIRSADPWILHLKVEDGVAHARFLHTDLPEGVDPTVRARRLATLLLQILPGLRRALVEAVAADLRPLAGVPSRGTVDRKRSTVQASSTTRWQRTRMLIGAALASGGSDPSDRVHAVLGLLAEIADFLDDATRIWCHNHPRRSVLQEIIDRNNHLLAVAEDLVPATDSTLHSIQEAPNGKRVINADPVGRLARMALNVVQRLLFNEPARALRAYVAENPGPDLERIAADERWELAGTETPPSSLSRIDCLYENLAAVLGELLDGCITRDDIARIARRGNPRTALVRAAQHARDSAHQRLQTGCAALTAEAQRNELEVRILEKPSQRGSHQPWPPVRHAVLVETPQCDELGGVQATVAALVTKHLPCTTTAVLLVPTLHGRPLTLAARQIHGGMGPAEDLLDLWVDDLPEPWPTPLTQAVTEAHQALEALSAISVLPPGQRDTPEVELAGNTQLQRVQSAFERVHVTEGRVPEVILGELVTLFARVQSELEARPPGTQRLSSQLAAASHGETNQDATDRTFFLAHAWMHDLGVHPVDNHE